MKLSLRGVMLFVLGICMLTGTATASDAAEAESVLNSGDTAWMLVSALLVLMMCLPGLALFYGGLVRSKNVLSIFVQCFAMAGVMSILWVVFGYALATGDSWKGIIGWDSAPWKESKFFLNHITNSKDGLGSLHGTIPETVFIMFQMTFIIISPAIIIGAFAERMKFSAMLIFTVIWTVLSYLPMWHMVWGGGLLHGWGAVDFAGGNVVHINAGVAGLVACIFIGKRKGFPGPALVPHNVPYVLVGAALLWVGWFGFNAGSQLAADAGAGMAMLVTQVATASALVVWMGIEWIVAKKPTAVGAATGAVAGLVAITPAAGTSTVLGALVIGAVSSLVCYLAATKLKHALGYDDSLDVFGVHGVGGIVGAILTGWFMRDGSGSLWQVFVQGQSIALTVVWSAAAAFVGLFVAKLLCGGIRVEEDTEHSGLDRADHGEEAYNWEA